MLSVRRTLFALAIVVGATASGPCRAEAQMRTHVVRSGDTLARIARRYHVTIAAITRANRIRGTTVREGARLRIPARERAARGGARRVTVRGGDTLARLARRHHTTVADLRAANGMRSDRLREGARLYVPRRGQSGRELRALIREGNAPRRPDPPVDEAIAAEASARAGELELGPLTVAHRLLSAGADDPRWREASGSPEEMEGTLLLPVEGGRYLRGWGSGRGGYHLAVDIGAPTGTEVHAAAGGVVAYAAHGVRGYGNFVLIVHPNGWVTAYAHNDQNLVVPGQRVARGELIARVGSTGFARGPHLHFMLVYEGEHCDPTPLFRPRITRASGVEVDEPEVVWDTEHRPSGIRCLPRSARPHPHYGRRRHRRRGRRR